jgi:hypothetical protein
MKRLNWKFATNAAIALLSLSGLSGLSGCVVAPDHGPYTWDHGDRVDRYGHREEHWCDGHHDDEHCR